MDSCLVVGLGEGSRAGRRDCLSMVRGNYRRGVAGVGIDCVVGVVGVVEEDNLGHRELAVVEVLDHSQVVVSHMDSAVAGGHCNSAGHRSRLLRNNLDSTC